jgi:hypothetical protein
MSTEWFGIAGVALLLIAFGLNLIRRLAESHPVYLLMNFFGAALAAVYALRTGAVPFVILESVWGAFAAIKLVQGFMRRPAESTGN